MLHRALSVYRSAEGRGVDVLEPEYFHAGAGRGGLVQPLGDPVLAERAQACNPRHQDFEEVRCRSYFPSAYVVAV